MANKKGEGAGKGDADRVTNFRTYWNRFEEINWNRQINKNKDYIKSRFSSPTGCLILPFSNEKKKVN